jgi:hypothetical protein
MNWLAALWHQRDTISVNLEIFADPLGIAFEIGEVEQTGINWQRVIIGSTDVPDRGTRGFAIGRSRFPGLQSHS